MSTRESRAENPMTSRERLYAAYRGEPVDRVPIWLREGFPVLRGPADADHYTEGWQAEPLYRELFEYVAPHVEDIIGWGLGTGNRYLMIPSKAIRREVIHDTPELRRHKVIVDTPRGELTSIVESHRHEATGWIVKHLVESTDELEKLASVPFEVDPDEIARGKENYRKAHAQYGSRAMLRTGVSSPAVCISGAMPFELFLELSLVEEKWFHELTDEVTRRQLAILEAVFDDGPYETTVTLGGSEQCTPPMMAPECYDKYVVPYDGRLVGFFHQRGIPVSVHCHGKVRRALECMVDMGVDATDPVEPPPAGDVTYAEAREIAADRLTLIGNIEWDMLETADPHEIRAHVREILSHGNRRLVLGASAGPISAVSRRLVNNYKAWVDTALQFGG